MHPRRLDGTALGDPANIVLSDDRRTAFVMNHHGGVANAEFLQHGGRASVAVMDVHKMLDHRLDDTDAALEHDFDAGWFGGVGLLVTPGLIVAGYSEGWLSEDGSNRIGLIDQRTGGMRGQIEMALTGRGTRQLRAGCTAFPVPFASPTEPPQSPRGRRSCPTAIRRTSAAGRIRKASPWVAVAMARPIWSRGTPAPKTSRSWTSPLPSPASASSRSPRASRADRPVRHPVQPRWQVRRGHRP